jgi:DNA-binding XRE family transcriptional regulator
MTAPIEHQVIEKDGQPLFVVVPYEEYQLLINQVTGEPTIPQDVVERHILGEKSLVRAWREHKGLRQRDVAARMGISQSAYSQIENSDSPLRPATRQRVAAVLGVPVRALTLDD